MNEIELKFQVPPESRAKLARAFGVPSARVLPLQAIYYDTPDRRLAAARLALRLRREKRRWMQAVKGETAAVHERLEHEQPVPAPARGAPIAPDPAVHDGTAAGLALSRAIGPEAPALEAVFQTRIRRALREIRSGRSVIAATLDIGEIRAGERRLPVHEVEFELVRGNVSDLLALCRRWAARFDLWLDVRSKAERGERLAAGRVHGDAQRAAPSTVPPDAAPDAALRHMVGECLRHALPNAADLAGGIGSADELHQLRVALRRLRTALRLYGPWSTAIDPGWQDALRELFAATASAREHDALEQSILPALRACGAPLAELPPSPPTDPPAARLRSPATTLLWLDLLTFSTAEPVAAASPLVDLASASVPLLRRLRRRLKKDAKHFTSLDDAERHRVRKRLKRLRYGADFVAPLFERKPLRRYLEALRLAQEALGAMNDQQVAAALFRDAAATDARAWFAAGWCEARKDAAAAEAQRQLRKLARRALPRRRGVSPAARTR